MRSGFLHLCQLNNTLPGSALKEICKNVYLCLLNIPFSLGKYGSFKVLLMINMEGMFYYFKLTSTFKNSALISNVISIDEYRTEVLWGRQRLLRV